MKKLGFGCMRLPMIGGPEGEVDLAQFSQMVDHFLEKGFTYFDTAHGYLHGKSEPALREALVRRYPRESYQLADKLTATFFQREEEIRPLFARQLEAAGVEYFDYYLIHSITAPLYEKFSACNAFAVAKRLQEEGKVRHLGISFHDKPALLERVFNEHPEIAYVQLQLNYVDWDSPSVESGALYDLCCQYGKPVIVMEPVKGGILAKLPAEGEAVLRKLGGSPASYAIRYAASLENVCMVLSGMSTLEQMEENTAFMANFQPLTEHEREALAQVRKAVEAQGAIACTACRYCVDGCPAKIPIPDAFACLNTKRQYQDANSAFYYGVSTRGRGRASDCIACGACEQVCPQHLPIRALLKDVAQAFDQEEKKA